MRNQHVCPDCLSNYKRSGAAKGDRKAGAWGRGLWPSWVYHSGANKKCEQHTAQANADSAARRAGINLATPAWADRERIKAVYLECAKASLATGKPHEVDHIVPLKGRGVCGLHVHWNLSVIPAVANRAKSNRFEPP